MSEYLLKEHDNGSVDLIEYVPTIVGTFPNRTFAERVLAALDGAVVPDTAPVPALPKPEKPTSKEVSTLLAMVPTEASWMASFALVAKNQKPMKDAAEALGVSFNQYRGKYAAWKKNRKVPATGSGSLDDREDCRLCGKSFKPSPDRMDLCAKCGRD